MFPHVRSHRHEKNACHRYVEVHMLKSCRDQQELYTQGSLLEIDTKLGEYGQLVKEHLVPLPGVFRSESETPSGTFKSALLLSASTAA